MVGRSTLLTCVTLALAAGCVGTLPEGDAKEETTDRDCPAWKIAVVIDGRIECTDEDVLERERETIENEDHW